MKTLTEAMNTLKEENSTSSNEGWRKDVLEDVIQDGYFVDDSIVCGIRDYVIGAIDEFSGLGEGNLISAAVEKIDTPYIEVQFTDKGADIYTVDGQGKNKVHKTSVNVVED